MTFDEQYPEADRFTEIEFEGSFLVKGGVKKPCWNCGTPTFWVDGCFEAHLCSPECERIKWREYEESFNASRRPKV